MQTCSTDVPAITSDLLRALPKAELHCHLDGSIRPSTLLELGREYKQPMPAAGVEALAEHMVVRDAHNLEDYLARFGTTLSVLQHADALERAAYELIEDAARDGVRYIEMRYAPVLNTRAGLSLGETVDATLRGIARGERARPRVHRPRRRGRRSGLREASGARLRRRPARPRHPPHRR